MKLLSGDLVTELGFPNSKGMMASYYGRGEVSNLVFAIDRISIISQSSSRKKKKELVGIKS